MSDDIRSDNQIPEVTAMASVTRRTFLQSLLARKDSAADSIIVCGLAGMFTIIFLSGWDVIVEHHEFNALTFGGGAAAIFAGIGGAKALRDGVGGNDPDHNTDHVPRP